MAIVLLAQASLPFQFWAYAKEGVTGNVHHSITRVAFPIIIGASKICQSTQRVAEVVPSEDDFTEESTQHVDGAENDGTMSLNNSGNVDVVTGSKPEVTNEDSETIPLGEEELPELPALFELPAPISELLPKLTESLAATEDVQHSSMEDLR
ncbi:hypothetical protein V6N11_010094 [Hibiscus sabdariffa]|uniref:Uncharacterized protein n=2 Tax=Hibiscus sabdariffa TaxID=183260 RepID=A0ABR1ZWC2_9ROSI